MPAANDVASVIIDRNGARLDAMSLQRPLYYMQACHMAITGEPLFESRSKPARTARPSRDGTLAGHFLGRNTFTPAPGDRRVRLAAARFTWSIGSHRFKAAGSV
ncbi:hypothetical protein [Nonomuraea sp. JJY05]|jgi:hypothetical protein|uniref:hypothetical protein n=1 Tax=Nonomuraea sp. JJY05 TaxID=3350255 RepID=UPI00373F7271